MNREQIRAKAVRLYTEGYSLRQIQKILNKMGFTVHFTTIKYWIDKPIYRPTQKNNKNLQ
jgi:transposase-like protein